MRAEEYARVRIEHVEVSVSDNFEFLLELRYKLEKIWENETTGDGNGDDKMTKWEGWMVVAMDWYTARASVRDARLDDVKATILK